MKTEKKIVYSYIFTYKEFSEFVSDVLYDFTSEKFSINANEITFEVDKRYVLDENIINLNIEFAYPEAINFKMIDRFSRLLTRRILHICPKSDVEVKFKSAGYGDAYRIKIIDQNGTIFVK